MLAIRSEIAGGPVIGFAPPRLSARETPIFVATTSYSSGN
jgi:hypothetical protein